MISPTTSVRTPSRVESGESYLLFAGNILKYFTVYHSYLHTTIKTLPVPNQHLLPDDLPHDIHADPKQLGEWGVRVTKLAS